MVIVHRILNECTAPVVDGEAEMKTRGGERVRMMMMMCQAERASVTSLESEC